MSVHKLAASSYILHPMFSNVIPSKGSHEAFLNPLCCLPLLSSWQHLECIHKKIQCIEADIELHKLMTGTKIYYYIN